MAIMQRYFTGSTILGPGSQYTMDSGLREKRRRKILDNAESRLERLRGIKKGKEVEVTRTCIQSASITESPPPTARTAAQHHHISLLHAINTPLVVTLRLLATMLASILALSTSPPTSLIILSIICTSVVVAMAAVTAVFFPPSPQPHNLGWLHTIPSLLSSVSSTAGLVASHSLAVASIVLVLGRDLLLAVFFSVLCSLCRDVLNDIDQY